MTSEPKIWDSHLMMCDRISFKLKASIMIWLENAISPCFDGFCFVRENRAIKRHFSIDKLGKGEVHEIFAFETSERYVKLTRIRCDWTGLTTKKEDCFLSGFDGEL